MFHLPRRRTGLPPRSPQSASAPVTACLRARRWPDLHPRLPSAGPAPAHAPLASCLHRGRGLPSHSLPSSRARPPSPTDPAARDKTARSSARGAIAAGEMEELEKPRGATDLWFLRRIASESAKSGAPPPEPSQFTPFGRAPAEAGFGAAAEALPKRALKALLWNITGW